VSSIGRVGAIYAQNAKTIEGYENALGAGRFATVRGLQLSADDVMRRAMIMDIMCRGRLDFAAVKAEFGVDAPTAFAAELARLEPLVAHGLVVVKPDAVEVTPVGWYVVRAVAMVFDRYLAAASASRASFSRIV
jgi:oxygen-independent coproporphyrinogen-3 oxidase